jgi:ABC-type transporter Mla maintaining outer membrane lipid asymmetry permease subunit MlaE
VSGETMIIERILIALILVAFLIGLGGGYFISKSLSQIENLFGIKTWHTVTTFNLVVSNNSL